MTNRTVLGTGGAGYIGSHACKALAAAGYNPVVFDNLVYGHDWAVKWGRSSMAICLIVTVLIMQSISLRYFNAAGADLDGDIGEVHDPETHLIPLALRAATGPDSPLTIFGDDYPTPYGSCVRDYIHVSDLADAHVLALRGLEQEESCGFYNLGTGRGYSVKEVVSTSQAVVGAPVQHSIGARRTGYPPSLVANAKLFSSLFGWQPGVSDLKTIIESAWPWELKSQHARPLQQDVATALFVAHFIHSRHRQNNYPLTVH